MTLQPVGYEDSDISLASGRLRVRRWGAADAPAVVCVPGLSANLCGFDRLAERLAGETLQLVAIDLRGRGRSEVTGPGTYGWRNHARDVLDIWRKVACLSQSQREAIGLWVRDKQSRRLKMPGYDALNDLLAAVDPAAYARALTAWLQANAGLLPRTLALDGKSVGDGRCGMIITLCRHEDGRPVAMAPATGKKEDCEVSQGRTLLASHEVQLVNALVTADPLHNKKATARVILEKGGDYLIGTKENTPVRLAAATGAVENAPLFS